MTLAAALSRLPRRPKRATGSINPATGEVSGAWVTLYWDWEGPLCDLGLWLLRQSEMLAAHGLEVGEVSTGRAGLSITEREGVWSGTIRFGVRTIPAPLAGERAGEQEGRQPRLFTGQPEPPAPLTLDLEEVA